MSLIRQFRQRTPRILLGLTLVAIFAAHAAGWLGLQLIERLDNIIYDAQMRLTAPGGVDPRVVIIDIDEKSLREQDEGGAGRWPWARDKMALLTHRLFDDYGIQVLGFDVIFSERDETSGTQALDALARGPLASDPLFQAAYANLRPQLDYDAQFAASLTDSATVLGFSFLTVGDTQTKGVLPPPALTASQLPPALVDPRRREGYTGNLAMLQSAASSGGHVNPVVDLDGVLRRMPMLIEYRGNYYAALSLAMAQALLGGEQLKPILPSGPQAEAFGSVEIIDVGGAQLPVDHQLASFIPYRGPYGSFRYVPAIDVLNKTLPKETLDGKIGIVGSTAAGLLDLRSTPVGKEYPGVEVTANLIVGILDGTIRQSPLWSYAVNVAIILTGGIFLALTMAWVGALPASLLTTLLCAVAMGINVYAWRAGIVLPIAGALSCFLLIFLLNVGFSYFFESRNKRLITALFGQYVPPDLVTEMSKDPGQFSMEGRSETLTILFSDVRGFTTISEGLEPRELSELMNAFLTPFTEIIYQHAGTIDKYMGDCIMAFWGAPVADADHARHGVAAALEMLRALEKINKDFEARGWPRIRVGIGLNTGRVSVGNMGSEIRLAYTAMGDAVNLASRLEGITKEYGVPIVIGEQTYRAVPGLLARELDRVRVKGKDEAVTIYEPLGFDAEPDTLEALDMFANVLAMYRAQRWDAAQAILERLIEDFSQTGEILYKLYVTRINYLRENPPDSDWDGSFTFTTK
ncbi:MAG: adenylate/guanylate cyclase domain-containing protein [Burkholderiales bacterium]